MVAGEMPVVRRRAKAVARQADRLGAKLRATAGVPNRRCIMPSPASIPGTDTESGPVRGMPAA